MVFNVENRTYQRVFAIKAPITMQTGFPFMGVIPELSLSHLVLGATTKEVFACLNTGAHLGAENHAHP